MDGWTISLCKKFLLTLLSRRCALKSDALEHQLFVMSQRALAFSSLFVLSVFFLKTHGNSNEAVAGSKKNKTGVFKAGW